VQTLDIERLNLRKIKLKGKYQVKISNRFADFENLDDDDDDDDVDISRTWKVLERI
jgi:hypothetical protein